MKLTDMPKTEADLLQAAIEVAHKEQLMYIAQDAYQLAYDNFKLAQQHLHDMQTQWLKAEQLERGEHSNETDNGSQ